MVKWFVDKNNKIPLYLQLENLIRYYVSTGSLAADERMPTVKEMSNNLGINSETIRKAYKDLEREGLISTRRGSGTFVTGSAANLSADNNGNFFQPAETKSVDSLEELIKKRLRGGASADEIRASFEAAMRRAALETAARTVVFTECNRMQIKTIPPLLKEYLGIEVQSVLVADLKEKIRDFDGRENELLAVITTVFHINEVREQLAGLKVKTDFLVTNMSPETRRELEVFDKNADFGFVCRDQETLFYKDILKSDLGLTKEIEGELLGETGRVKKLLKSVEVLLVPPSVYDEVMKMKPKNLPIYNVFDRVDPISLKVIKDRLLMNI